VPIPGRAFAPVIVFMPRFGDGCKPGDGGSEWLPRQCPACGQAAIIVHGRRRRPAHDGVHDWILVRRGLCEVCGGTLTVLPERCVPGAPYGLSVRQEALTNSARECPPNKPHHTATTAQERQSYGNGRR